MALFTITWESWERGSIAIEAASEDEARKLFDDKVGSLEPYDEGIDIVEIESGDEDDHEQAEV